MSRIVGCFGFPSVGAADVVGRMVGSLVGTNRWSATVVPVPGGALGWCGWKSPLMETVEGMTCVMDGVLYDAGGADQNDARTFCLRVLEVGFEEAVRRSEGDFAVALYDERGRTLWLSRDRFGVKPLYYVRRDESLAFASRPRALWQVPGVLPQPDPTYIALTAASHYRVFDYDRCRSPFVNVSQLPAGHFGKFHEGRWTSWRYWDLREQPDWMEGEEALADRYRQLFVEAVERRVRVAQRPAFTLSGGLDSSSILSTAARRTGRRWPALSVVYEDKTFDESPEIQAVARSSADPWVPVHVGEPEVIPLVQAMIEIHDEPVATATWLSHYVLCQEARQRGFATLFGGLGGDELNAGEYEYFLYFFADLQAQEQADVLSVEIDRWVAHHDHPVYRKDRERVEKGFARLVDFAVPGRCQPDRNRLERYRNALRPDFFDLRTFFPFAEAPFKSYLKSRTYQDLFFETLPCCLRAQDRHGSAFELDHALPFLDHRLVEFMFRVPGHLKIRRGITKHLLRLAMDGILPEETRTRVKKMGWNAPAHVWFSGRNREPLLDLVGSRGFRERGIYDVDEVLRLVREHEEIVRSGRAVENHMMFLWQVLNLELWLRSLGRAA